MFSFDFLGPEGVERRPVETRVMRFHPDLSWRYYSYRWNEAGTDAELLDGSRNALLDVVPSPELRTSEESDDDTVELLYHFPSVTTCQACHGMDEVGVAGPTPVQMNLDVTFNGTLKNQLEAFAELGLLNAMPSNVPQMPNPIDETAPLESRARAYLHANCAHCHRPDGYRPPDVEMDLRYTTPFAEADLCNAETSYNAGATGHRLVPGNPEQSALFRRFTSDGVDRMPLAAGQFFDPFGTALLREWIESLSDCP
jgi:mono/diheme cytochrome c family protein